MTDNSTYWPTSAGATYSWSVTGGTYTGIPGNTTTETITPTSNGTFMVTLSVTNGWCTSTSTVPVNVVIPDASFTVNPNPTCSKDIAYFNAASGYVSYYWSFGDGSYSLSAPAANPQHQYTNNTNAPVNFTATLTVTTPDGCTDTKTQVVTVHPKPIVFITPTPATICRGSSVILTANINANGNTMCSSYTYQWKKNGVNIPGATASTYPTSDYGLYSVFVSGATPSCNCNMLSDTAVVKFYPDPVADIETGSTVCFDPSFNPWSFSVSAVNNPGYTYNWSSNNGGITFSPNNSTSNLTTVTGTLVNNTSFVIYLQVVDVNGCTATDSLCIYTYKNPDVSISASGTLCANSVNTISVISPSINNSYIWNTGASGTGIITTVAGNYYATATDLLTGCSAISNTININHSPSLQLFPVGCDTVCVDDNITIPLAQLPNLNNYYIEWYDGIKPAGTLIYAGNGAVTIPGNFLSLGLHHLWTTVSFPNGCNDSSGVFDVFVKKCCNCSGSNWAFKQFSIDNGTTYNNWLCGQEEIGISCNPLTVNAAYNCSPAGCGGTVTGQILDNLGNVIQNISLPYTYTPVPGTAGSFYIKLIGWCDGVKCDSCTRQVFYNCPLPEPPCVCDTGFHFTGQPVIVIPQIDEGFVAGGTPVPLNCGNTYPGTLECQKNYQFYINYQNPWPSGNCQAMVVGEILLGGNIVYTQNNISQANPMNYFFTSQGNYCVKFKLVVNGTTCDSCIVCFNVYCNVPCNCMEGFHFTGKPLIIANLPNANIKFPSVNCHTSLAKPLMCNTSYSFSIAYNNPYNLPCIAKDSAVVTMAGNPVPLIINPNTSPGNPITFTFTQSGTYCVKHYLTVNGVVCDSCIVCFSVECPTPCNCDAFDFLSDPAITFSMGTIKGIPVVKSLSSPCETSLATPFQCKRPYKFFINAGAIGAEIPADCRYFVNATLYLNNVPIKSVTNVSQLNPLTYTFSKEGVYCIKYELYVNGVLCKTCIQCFSVRCCPVYYALPPLKGNFVGCVIGGTTYIYNDSTGGTFTSLDTTVARVDNEGNVTAVGYGKAIIVYNWVKDPCDFYVVAEYSVPQLTPLPPITGNAAICRTGDSLRLSNAGAAGLWTSGDPAIARVSTTTRTRSTYIRGLSSGEATITYNVIQLGCPLSVTKNIIVHNIIMEPVTGPSEVCKGRSILLENATIIPGDFASQWRSLNSRAIVDNNGYVTGMSAGTGKVRYQLNYSNPVFGNCSVGVEKDITVFALPSKPYISFVIRPVLVPGTTSICMYKSFVLKGSIAGGVWTSAGSLTVNNSGVVTPVSPGSGTVTYTVFNGSGCSASRTLTYDVLPCEQFSKASNEVPAPGNKKIILYPNPAQTKVYFDVDAANSVGSVYITDLHGKQIKRAVLKAGINQLDITSFATGIYFVIFRTRSGTQTEKLIIE